mmetsp:Transcript_3570/g.6920  ORF Transcript_3570/g.6920 Transcript_3570/m.6920 type:complete len:234 (-) Transcript_3570:229-930(-)
MMMIMMMVMMMLNPLQYLLFQSVLSLQLFFHFLLLGIQLGLRDDTPDHPNISKFLLTRGVRIDETFDLVPAKECLGEFRRFTPILNDNCLRVLPILRHFIGESLGCFDQSLRCQVSHPHKYDTVHVKEKHATIVEVGRRIFYDRSCPEMMEQEARLEQLGVGEPLIRCFCFLHFKTCVFVFAPHGAPKIFRFLPFFDGFEYLLGVPHLFLLVSKICIDMHCCPCCSFALNLVT